MNTETPIPSDVQAEEYLLGSVLMEQDQFGNVSDVVRPADFYREIHGWIYEAMITCANSGSAIDIVTVAGALESTRKLEAVGGREYLAYLVQCYPVATHAADWAEAVRRCAIARKLISAAGKIGAIGYAAGEPDAMIAKAFEELLAVEGVSSRSGLRTLDEIAAAHADEIDQWLIDPRLTTGEQTGLESLDSKLDGLHAGRLYVLAARPSMGKSQLALYMAQGIARTGKQVAVFSLEMSAKDNLHRLVMAAAGLNDYDIRHGRAPYDWRERYNEALGQIRTLGIRVDDTAAITTGTVRSRVTALRHLCPNLGLLVVDYAQIMGDEVRESEERRIGSITSRLKAMSSQLNCPVLALYQLNREVEKRPRRIPQLADLRSSGQIEQDADVVLMLYRKSYYAERHPELPEYTCAPGEEKQLTVLVEKNRQGPTGVFQLWYDASTGRISDWGQQ